MLVYRDFAIQDDRRTYLPGPALAASQVVGRPLPSSFSAREWTLPLLTIGVAAAPFAQADCGGNSSNANNMEITKIGLKIRLTKLPALQYNLDSDTILFVDITIISLSGKVIRNNPLVSNRLDCSRH